MNLLINHQEIEPGSSFQKTYQHNYQLIWDIFRTVFEFIE